MLSIFLMLALLLLLVCGELAIQRFLFSRSAARSELTTEELPYKGAASLVLEEGQPVDGCSVVQNIDNHDMLVCTL